MSHPWSPKNYGTGKRIWFLHRNHPSLLQRYLYNTNGQLKRFASYESASRTALTLNAR